MLQFWVNICYVTRIIQKPEEELKNEVFLVA